jgi:hypothetical protein
MRWLSVRSTSCQRSAMMITNFQWQYCPSYQCGRWAKLTLVSCVAFKRVHERKLIAAGSTSVVAVIQCAVTKGRSEVGIAFHSPSSPRAKDVVHKDECRPRDHALRPATIFPSLVHASPHHPLCLFLFRSRALGLVVLRLFSTRPTAHHQVGRRICLHLFLGHIRNHHAHRTRFPCLVHRHMGQMAVLGRVQTAVEAQLARRRPGEEVVSHMQRSRQ